MSYREVTPEVFPHVSALYTPEQYARMRHGTPYCYALGPGAQLQYVGVHHSFDPEDTIFALISGAVETRRPDVIFVEGVPTLHGPAGLEKMVRSLSYTNAIKQGGEAVYAIKEALRRNVSWASPEPADEELYQFLLQHYFSREEIFAWFVLSLVPQYLSSGEGMKFQAYAAPMVGQFKQTTGWKGFVYDVDKALEYVGRMLGFPVADVRLLAESYALVDPIPRPDRWEQQTLFNEISRTILEYRNQAMTQAVLNELAVGKRVLVVYDASLAVMQEPAYRAYFSA